MALKDRIEMMICYYGCEKDNHSGIAYAQFIPEKNQFEIISKIEMEGKINFAIWHKNQLFVPIAQDYQNRIYLYEFDNQKFHQVEYFDTTYFYSYGVLINNHYGYFASFASGENAIIDFNRKSELDIKHYKNGRSHYINRLKKGQVYAIDNANNKLLIYDDEHQKLLTKKTIEFLDEGPRLMPSHPSGKLGYLLMERTNRIIVFDFDDFTELQRIDVPNTTIDVDFCGGITVDEKGCFLCVTVRHKNEIVLFGMDENGLLIYLDSQACAEMPRDLLSENNYVFVTCTTANRIEVFEVVDNKLNRVNSTLELNQPVTFVNKLNFKD